MYDYLFKYLLSIFVMCKGQLYFVFLLSRFEKKYLFYFLVALGLHCCTWAFSGRTSGVSLQVRAACGLSLVVASRA